MSVNKNDNNNRIKVKLLVLAALLTFISFGMLLWRTIEKISIISVIGLAAAFAALVLYVIVLKLNKSSE